MQTVHATVQTVQRRRTMGRRARERVRAGAQSPKPRPERPVSPPKPCNLGVCYLCGQDGADSREHVVPACLWPAVRNVDALIAPAHRRCNGAHSKDEQYVRDLVAEGARAFPGAERLAEARDRGFRRPEAAAYKRQFFASARRAEMRTPGGLFVGTGWTVRGDHKRVCRVATKMFRGLMYLDQGALVPEADCQATAGPIEDFNRDAKRALRKGLLEVRILYQPETSKGYWLADGLFLRWCYMYIPDVSLQPGEDHAAWEARTWFTCHAHMVFGLYAAAGAVMACLPASCRHLGKPPAKPGNLAADIPDDVPSE